MANKKGAILSQQYFFLTRKFKASLLVEQKIQHIAKHLD
jgi:hypothetical protein